MLEFGLGLLIIIGIYFTSIEIGFKVTKCLNPTRDKSDVWEKVFAVIFGVMTIILISSLSAFAYWLGKTIIS